MPGATPVGQSIASKAVEEMGGRVVSVVVPAAVRARQPMRPISPEASPLEALSTWAAAQNVDEVTQAAMLREAQALLASLDGSAQAPASTSF
jgi:hypothetical protein